VANWGFAPGLLPASDVVPIPMDRMRDMILETFSGPGRKEPEG
jgi:hypothetical protein